MVEPLQFASKKEDLARFLNAEKTVATFLKWYVEDGELGRSYDEAGIERAWRDAWERAHVHEDEAPSDPD